MTVIEVLTFPSSEEFKTDPVAAAKDLHNLAAKAPGFLKWDIYCNLQARKLTVPRFYYGSRVSDSSYGHVFIVWNTFQDQETFHASHQMSIIQAIGQIVSKRNRPFALTRQNIDIGEDAAYEAVLGAPVTLFQKLVSNTSVSGSQGVVSGHIMEEKGTSATITGWDTEDSSKEIVSNTESYFVKLTPYNV